MAYSKIKIAPSKVGSLHKLLGIAQGNNIPSGDLATKSGDSSSMKKKKNFARNARKFNHPALSKLMGR